MIISIDKPDSPRAEAEEPCTHALPSEPTQEQLLHELQVHQIELEMQNDELRRAQLALEESRDRYVDLYEFSPVGYFALTRAGMIAEANLTGSALLGMDRQKLLRRRFAAFIVPEDCDRWHGTLLRALQRDAHQSCELALRRGDNTIIHARLDCLRTGPDDEFSIRIALTDITARKQADKYLRIISSVFDHSYQAIVITDADNVILDANPAFAKIVSHARTGMIGNAPDANSASGRASASSGIAGKRISDIIPGIVESCPELFEAYGRVAAGGSLEKFETYMLELGIWFSVSIYCPEQGCFVAIFDDVTQRIRSEQELLVINHSLAHEVEKRTSDLSAINAHIQKIAEEERANIARELHDELGSTLTGIQMGIGHLRGKVTAPDILEDLSLIKDLAANASQITRGVINHLYPTMLDSCGFVAAVDMLIRNFAKYSGIEAELICSEEQFDMEHTFALAAYRIVQECLTNIGKHAVANKAVVEIRASNGFLDLTVRDNGKGRPAEIDADCHGIAGMIERARYLGGSLRIESEQGNGVAVHLSLPLAIAKPANKKRVLVVDDHAIVRNALRQLLDTQTDDFSVEGEASDGKAAIQMAIEGTWDIMLLDITLPKKNGIKVLGEVKAVKPGLPIIMLSTHSVEEYGEIAFSKGASDYIEKCETSKLIEAMRRATQPRE